MNLKDYFNVLKNTRERNEKPDQRHSEETGQQGDRCTCGSIRYRSARLQWISIIVAKDALSDTRLFTLCVNKRGNALLKLS